MEVYVMVARMDILEQIREAKRGLDNPYVRLRASEKTRSDIDTVLKDLSQLEDEILKEEAEDNTYARRSAYKYGG
jgi:hypothetical protein